MRAVGFRSADRVEGFGFDFFSVSERFRDEVHFLFFFSPLDTKWPPHRVYMRHLARQDLTRRVCTIPTCAIAETE